MPRNPRLIVPGMPHHVTQRGTRRQQTFFGPGDYQAYKLLLAEWCQRRDIAIWAYCLMPNHVHLIVAPSTSDGLSSMVGQVHRRYSRMINKRMDWTGHLWQERFYSCVMDEAHTLSAMRYVEQNSVRSNLVKYANEWNWSSAPTHLGQCRDDMVVQSSLAERIGNWADFLSIKPSESRLNSLRTSTNKGIPAGDEKFLGMLQESFGLKFSSGKRGRPRKNS